MPFQVEKGIRAAPVQRYKSAYPLASMEVGDSFAVPVNEQGADKERAVRRVYSAVQYAKRNYGKTFQTRQVMEHGQLKVRVWRT